MKKQPEAFEFDECNGFFTRYCHTLQEAYVAMQKAVAESDDKERIIDINEIKIDTAYTCKKEGYTTIGDNICIDCGHEFVSNGRQTFVYFFD